MLAQGMRLIALLVDGVACRVLKRPPIRQHKAASYREDQILRGNDVTAKDRCAAGLSLSNDNDQEQQQTIQFLRRKIYFQVTTTIAAISAERSAVELFRQPLKQSLKIRPFLGTTATAVKTQSWVTKIFMPMLRVRQPTTTWRSSLSKRPALLCISLTTCRSLSSWLAHLHGELRDPGTPLQATLRL
ncbi:MAG: hypothetical protein ACYCT1_14790 [Steroidobacteraceae bacterium]